MNKLINILKWLYLVSVLLSYVAEYISSFEVVNALRGATSNNDPRNVCWSERTRRESDHNRNITPTSIHKSKQIEDRMDIIR